MTVEAVIFDMDGTLVDTNRAHVEAWWRAFERCGFSVPVAHIAREIGKGGDMLVPAVLGEAVDKEHGDALREYNGQEFLQIAAYERFAVFPEVSQLMQTLRERGLKVALATSAKKEFLEAIEKSAEVDIQSMVDLVVTANDAQRSKPAPDLIEATITKLDIDAAQCVMVGDTPHDAEACKRAGVVCFGVLTGGHTRETLLNAGAQAVWNDVADLLAHLDDALELVALSATH